MKKFICILIMQICLIPVFSLSKGKYIKFRYNEKYGLLNTELELVKDNIYYDIFFINDLIFCDNGKQCDVFDKKLNFLKSIKTDYIRKIFYLNESLYFISCYSTPNIIYDSKENEIKETSYSFISNKFNQPMKPYLSGIFKGRMGYIDKDEQIYFDNKDFEYVYPFINNKSVVLKKNWKKAIIDLQGEIVLDEILNCGWQFKDGLLPVITDNDSGFINEKCEFVIHCTILDENKNDNITGSPNLQCFFSEGLAYVHTTENEWIIVNKKGEIIKKLPYRSDTSLYSEGLIGVHNSEDLHGYLNKKGDVEIPFVFERVESFNNGYANVIYKGKNAILDKKGNIYLSEDLVKGDKKIYINVKQLMDVSKENQL